MADCPDSIGVVTGFVDARMVSMVSPHSWIYGVEAVETGETVDSREVQ
jgi:hypothetical protein